MIFFLDVLKWELAGMLTVFTSTGQVSRHHPFAPRLSVSRENVINVHQHREAAGVAER